MKKLSIATFACLLLCSNVVSAQGSNPSGRLIDMGGYRMHFNVMGTGDKTLVIEPGTGAWSLQWMEFQKELAKTFRVVTYDRAGYGWSEPSPYSRSANTLAEELHSGLAQLGIEGPYILLGHSYGGLIVKAFAKNYPAKVAALIFADAATEYQFEKLPEAVNALVVGSMAQFKEMGVKARNAGLPARYMPVDSTLNPAYWASYQQSISKASYYEAMYNELDLLPLTYEQAWVEKETSIPALILTAQNSFGAFAHIPMIPVEESNEIWMKLQEALAKRYANSQHEVIPGATHDLLITQPDAFREAVVKFVKGL